MLKSRDIDLIARFKCTECQELVDADFDSWDLSAYETRHCGHYEGTEIFIDLVCPQCGHVYSEIQLR